MTYNLKNLYRGCQPVFDFCAKYLRKVLPWKANELTE